MRADNEMPSRLAELVVVDAQGAVQPLEHVDFGDSELFFSGMQTQCPNMFAMVSTCALCACLRVCCCSSSLHCWPLTCTPNRGGADHYALLYSMSNLPAQHCPPNLSWQAHALSTIGLQG